MTASKEMEIRRYFTEFCEEECTFNLNDHKTRETAQGITFVFFYYLMPSVSVDFTHEELETMNDYTMFKTQMLRELQKTLVHYCLNGAA